MITFDVKVKSKDRYEKNIYIWGTGMTTRLALEGLKRHDFSFEGFVDNNQDKWGETLLDKAIISPAELSKKNNVYVLICSHQESVVKSVGNQLDALGIPWENFEAYVIQNNIDRVQECFELLEDDISQKVYLDVINHRINSQSPSFNSYSSPMYFCLPAFLRYGEEVFIDCGAYVGDSIEQYIWNKSTFKKIIAFEPDPHNFRALNRRVERLKEEWAIDDDKIILVNAGVGKDNALISFEEATNGGKFVDDANISAEGKNNIITQEIVSLDKYLDCPYHFLKADIESYEYDMILGAQDGIRNYKPNIAVCIYHNIFDMFDIQLLLHELVPEYKFAVRHHRVTMDDTVLYAWIDQDGWIQK